MSWIDKLRRKRSDDEHKQLLFFSTGDLINENYAVVRTTWYERRRVIAVTETCIHSYDEAMRAEMRDVIKCALQAGADVSLVCVETPGDLGLKRA
tara:strand:- start:923 stop:1207 length:285 start_codon:yes stop_codon:yes gene_type:complete